MTQKESDFKQGALFAYNMALKVVESQITRECEKGPHGLYAAGQLREAVVQLQKHLQEHFKAL